VILERKAVSEIMLTLLLTGMLTLALNIQLVKAEPRTWTVDDDGTADFHTIQEAINAANTGDTVYVRNGTYYEHIVINKTISLTGENKNTTIIDGNKAETVVKTTANNVTISGFTIQNGEIGIDLNSNSNTITSNIISSNGAQETDLKANLEIYPEPPSVPIWRFLYDLINSSYTEFLDLTTDIPILMVKVLGHSDVAELCLGLFYDENIDGIPQLNEYAGFGSRDQVTWVVLPNPPEGRYIIKVQGWNVLGNPGHFDREITKFKGYGIGAHLSSNNTISQNLITENYAGLYLQSCSRITAHKNNVTKNLGAIIVGDLANSTFYDNKAFDNNQTICMRSAKNINLTNNVLYSNVFGIHIWNSSSINITENDLYSHGGWSIGLISSVDNKVANNNISTVKGLDGIRLMFSSRNNLTGNNISHCEHSGILLWYDCYNNSATNNYISFSGSQGWGHGHGVEVLLSYNNLFENNSVLQARNQGIIAIETSRNNFTGNTISSNAKGIILWSSSENRVYHNSIVYNQEQQSFDETGENFWDDGYPNGGNYWSDYTGVDLYGGPYQNETGSDGLGDIQYVIDANNQDCYPLMKPYRGPHDIGITSVNISKTIVGQGYSVNMRVKIINYGEETETFNVTIYANTTIIEHIEITLTSRNSIIPNFTWNTTGFVKGNYTIWANATSVPGETDMEDNTFLDGVVYVGIPGDLNCDSTVNILDAILLAGSLCHPELNPNADINNDQKVNILDAIILACHFGKTHP